MMMKEHIISFCVFVTVISKCTVYGTEQPIIKTPLGHIMGRYTESYGGRTVTAFEGIPYAKPPLGELRFKEPQPVDPWLDIFVANKTYACIQHATTMRTESTTGVEDCLYLYVYVPREIINGSENLDVIVSIHSGAFTVGDPKLFGGPLYIMDRDLVFVSMNYRLGILGFLSTEDQVVPGNNGLKDQVLAMKWVKENIQYFGGNPNSITLTGLSAGSASVHYHYFSPLCKGLFHRGVSLSGTALNPWALTTNPLASARKLGELFNCNTESSQQIVDCLREIPAHNLTTAINNFFEIISGMPPNTFGPVIEPRVPCAFLTEHPYKLLNEGKFNDIPWITSNTKDEGITPVGFYILYDALEEFNIHWNEVLPYSLVYYDTIAENDKLIVAERIKDRYLGNESLSMENIFNFVQMHTDRLYLVDAERAIRLQAKTGKSPVYYYYFDYLIDMPVVQKAQLACVAHGDDSRILFHQAMNSPVLSENDYKMKEVLLDFLYDFATTGTPNFKGIEWKPVSPANEETNFMHVSSSEEIRMESVKEMGASSFWNSLPFIENARLSGC